MFPYIVALENAVSSGRPRPRPAFGTVSNPVHMMELEHDSAGAALKEISALSANYMPPEGACFSYRTLYTALKEFETDLHQHIHLENNILFPRAIALESGAEVGTVMPSFVAVDEIRTAQEPAILLKAREESAQRLMMAYAITGLFFMLLPGTFLGVWNLISISGGHATPPSLAAWIQAHGHAQIFGWIGTFILGIGFYSIPKMTLTSGRVQPSSRGWMAWGLWTSGVLLRWACGFLPSILARVAAAFRSAGAWGFPDIS